MQIVIHFVTTVKAVSNAKKLNSKRCQNNSLKVSTHNLQNDNYSNIYLVGKSYIQVLVSIINVYILYIFLKKTYLTYTQGKVWILFYVKKDQ